jgi:hypothetical protein
MAEFSKQYKDAFNFDWHDFDYEEIFEKLEKNQAYPLICEGLGTLAVAKSNEGKMLLAVQSEDESDMIIWKTLEDAIEMVRNSS